MRSSRAQRVAGDGEHGGVVLVDADLARVGVEALHGEDEIALLKRVAAL